MKTVLFLSSRNDARSIFAEAVMHYECEGRFDVFSAGSTPSGAVHPLVIETLREAGYGAAGLASKSWDSFADRDAPEIHYMITLCDRVAEAPLPAFSGAPVRGHWGLIDPCDSSGNAQADRTAYRRTLAQIEARILAFRSLPVENMTKVALRHALETIGTMEGASPLARDPA